MTPAEQLAFDLGAGEQLAPPRLKRARSPAVDAPLPAMLNLVPLPPRLAPIVGQAAARPESLLEIAPAVDEAEAMPGEPFGLWLLQQTARKGWLGDLAKAVRSDPGFPKRGTPDDVRRRFREVGADGDAFEALDDAEMKWAATAE